MNTTHTPGPLTVHQCGNGEIDIKIATECLASVHHIGHTREAEQRANAILFSAAPEMLAALKALYSECAMVHKQWGEESNSKQANLAIKNGLAAIAKAEGRTA